MTIGITKLDLEITLRDLEQRLAVKIERVAYRITTKIIVFAVFLTAFLVTASRAEVAIVPPPRDAALAKADYYRLGFILKAAIACDRKDLVTRASKEANMSRDNNFPERTIAVWIISPSRPV
jgi:hypothetical protein